MLKYFISVIFGLAISYGADAIFNIYRGYMFLLSFFSSFIIMILIINLERNQ